MKKIIQNILVFGILISVPLVPSHVNTPETLAEWFREEGFSYQAEALFQDHWKTPEETIRDKGGDCEDFAFLTDKVLSDNGYETYVIAIYFKKTAHAITIIKIDNKYAFFDNMYYINHKFNNLNDLLNFYYSDWLRYRKMFLPKRFGPIIMKK
jgi:hypothetical protein